MNKSIKRSRQLAGKAPSKTKGTPKQAKPSVKAAVRERSFTPDFADWTKDRVPTPAKPTKTAAKKSKGVALLPPPIDLTSSDSTSSESMESSSDINEFSWIMTRATSEPDILWHCICLSLQKSDDVNASEMAANKTDATRMAIINRECDTLRKMEMYRQVGKGFGAAWEDDDWFDEKDYFQALAGIDKSMTPAFKRMKMTVNAEPHFMANKCKPLAKYGDPGEFFMNFIESCIHVAASLDENNIPYTNTAEQEKFKADMTIYLPVYGFEEDFVHYRKSLGGGSLNNQISAIRRGIKISTDMHLKFDKDTTVVGSDGKLLATSNILTNKRRQHIHTMVSHCTVYHDSDDTPTSCSHTVGPIVLRDSLGAGTYIGSSKTFKRTFSKPQAKKPSPDSKPAAEDSEWDINPKYIQSAQELKFYKQKFDDMENILAQENDSEVSEE